MSLLKKLKNTFLEEVPNTNHLKPKDQNEEDFNIDQFIKELDKPAKERVNTKLTSQPLTSNPTPVVSKALTGSTTDLIGKTAEEYKITIQQKIASISTPEYQLFLDTLKEMRDIEDMSEKAAYKAAIKISGVSIEEINQVNDDILKALTLEQNSFESNCKINKQAIQSTNEQSKEEFNSKILQNKQTIANLNKENDELYDKIGKLTTSGEDEIAKVDQSLQTFLQALTEVKTQLESDSKKTKEHLQ